MKDLIEWHKKIIDQVQKETGLSSYALHWMSFIEGALVMWVIMRIAIASSST